MRDKSSATARTTVTADRIVGLGLGALGVLGFSLSLPATRIVVQQLDPWFVAFGRAVGAGLLAWAYLRLTGAPRPTRAQWQRLPIVALGVVVGFPLFTSMALLTQTSAHSAVVIAAAARDDGGVRGAAGRRTPAAAVLDRERRRTAGGARLSRRQRRGRRGPHPARPVPARGGRALRPWLRRGRRARPRAGRRSDDLLGVAALAARHRSRHGRCRRRQSAAGPTLSAGRRSAISPGSRCSWASSPGTRAWPGAA